jgi:hypothetical protein
LVFDTSAAIIYITLAFVWQTPAIIDLLYQPNGYGGNRTIVLDRSFSAVTPLSLAATQNISIYFCFIIYSHCANAKATHFRESGTKGETKSL